MLIRLNPLFVQLMQTQNILNFFEILKNLKTTIIVPTCFGLHKPSSGSLQSAPRQSYNVDVSVYTSLTFRRLTSTIVDVPHR